MFVRSLKFVIVVDYVSAYICICIVVCGYTTYCPTTFLISSHTLSKVYTTGSSCWLIIWLCGKNSLWMMLLTWKNVINITLTFDTLLFEPLGPLKNMCTWYGIISIDLLKHFKGFWWSLFCLIRCSVFIIPWYKKRDGINKSMWGKKCNYFRNLKLHLCSPKILSPVSWGHRIHRLHLCGWVRPLPSKRGSLIWP